MTCIYLEIVASNGCMVRWIALRLMWEDGWLLLVGSSHFFMFFVIVIFVRSGRGTLWIEFTEVWGRSKQFIYSWGWWIVAEWLGQERSIAVVWCWACFEFLVVRQPVIVLSVWFVALQYLHFREWKTKQVRQSLKWRGQNVCTRCWEILFLFQI